MSKMQQGHSHCEASQGSGARRSRGRLHFLLGLRFLREALASSGSLHLVTQVRLKVRLVQISKFHELPISPHKSVGRYGIFCTLPQPVARVRLSEKKRSLSAPNYGLWLRTGAPRSRQRTWAEYDGAQPHDRFLSGWQRKRFLYPQARTSNLVRAFETIHFPPKYAGANLGHPSLSYRTARFIPRGSATPVTTPG